MKSLLPAVMLLATCQCFFAKSLTSTGLPMQTNRPLADTNSIPRAKWHTIEVKPVAGLPKIHFYDKLNPLWWAQNADEPSPPAWYLPGKPGRHLKWRFRNPFHNFDFYVIGVADKTFVRSGRYPERNSDPHGGWNFALGRRRLALLPFVSYERGWITFYLGWREHGAFGTELRLHHRTTPTPASVISTP